MVEQMYEAVDQMGEDMPIGLGGRFEYRRVGEGNRGEVSTAEQEVGTADQSDVGGAEQGNVGGEGEVREVVTVAVPGSSGGVGSHGGLEEITDGWSADEYPSTMT